MKQKEVRSKIKPCSPEQQAKLCREIHSGVDPDEGINACRGMLFSCVAVITMIGLVWWLIK